MRSLVVNKDGSLAIKEVPTPKPGPKEALVKTIACGMCGTDVKIIHRTFKGVPESSYPLMLGHEGVGEVVETGAEVKGLKIGDRVLLPFVEPTPGFGSAWGAFSEYAIVQDVLAYEVGKAPSAAYAQTILGELDPVDSVMLVTFREVLSAIRYFGIGAMDSIAVFGCGPVGLTFIKLLSLLGCENIIAVDIDNGKLKEATINGAKITVNNKSEDVAAKLGAEYSDGVKYVLDAVGLPSIANQAMGLLQDRGSVLCYGVLEKEEITIDFSKASYNWSFVCQQMPSKEEEGAAHEQVLTWINKGKLVMKDFISDYFTFDESLMAFEKLLDRKLTKKGIIKF